MRRVTLVVSDSAILQTVACQGSLSERGFSRQEYWSALANTGCHTLLEHYFLLPQLPTPPSSTLCRIPHLNNKQNKNKTKIQAQSSADRITTSLSLDHQRKNKQTKTQHKSHSIGSSHWTNLRKAETIRKKEFNLLQGKNSTFFKERIQLSLKAEKRRPQKQ